MNTKTIHRPPEQDYSATSVPTGARRPVLVTGITIPRPTTVPAVLLGAARILRLTGLWQGDYLLDPCDREVSRDELPHSQRPMSIVAAIKCAATGDPHRECQLADTAIGVVALTIAPEPPYGDIFSLESIVEEWGDAEGRTAEAAVTILTAAADASEVSL
ncbi:hypothetical protein [Streptomyces sp. NPDC023838]|uniref:DUF6197 family protein n=1 Tax=Streptomyces sp. NPDC023838 TaxID=3154325 RepID=UPI0033F98EDC